jgi:hypothetical protein
MLRAKKARRAIALKVIYRYTLVSRLKFIPLIVIFTSIKEKEEKKGCGNYS